MPHSGRVPEQMQNNKPYTQDGPAIHIYKKGKVTHYVRFTSLPVMPKLGLVKILFKYLKVCAKGKQHIKLNASSSVANKPHTQLKKGAACLLIMLQQIAKRRLNRTGTMIRMQLNVV